MICYDDHKCIQCIMVQHGPKFFNITCIAPTLGNTSKINPQMIWAIIFHKGVDVHGLFCEWFVISPWSTSVVGLGTHEFFENPSTLANLTLIILFSEMLKLSKIAPSKLKNIVKKNSEYLKIFHVFKWIFQN